MSSKVEEFQSLVESKLQSKPVGFDITILVPILIQVLVQLFQNCGGFERAKREITKGGGSFWNRFASRKAILRAEQEADVKLSFGDRRIVQRALLDCCDECTEKEVDDLLDEVKEHTYELI